MDPEVQGILTAAQKLWPHIHISDSSVMADRAVKMAEAGCKYIAVLGVDFMSENVGAILDQADFKKHSGIYLQVSELFKFCLAMIREFDIYAVLEAASNSPPSLHVIYINTSLETKAYGHELVPTITCTSSNVVQTVFQDGNCIVHDMFGHEVVERIKELYCDAFLTAHFEVPGEMFSLAMEAKRRGMGVVGSTQNILDFIKNQLPQFVDYWVQGNQDVKQSPVLSDSVSRTSMNGSRGLNSAIPSDIKELAVVPGVANGEGCSIHGGCTSCPYMKTSV
ncbi:quinolinate synthase, chloroplastic-like [Musa acuminata AAA Group]|uniref:quinolinate synthase, chloroplastic-like n=1 Tax=Musa acuminata AAA Group TaxID=214697 RepID=UPI0031D013EF